MSEPSGRSQGLTGGEIIDDTDVHTGNWFGFTVINEAVIAAITQPTSPMGTVINLSGLVGLTLKDGLFVPGNFKTIDLTSGVVYAHNVN